MANIIRWDHLPAEVLSLVAARLHVDDPDAGPAETSSKPAGEAAFVLGPLDENDNADNDGRAEQVSSSSALAALRLVCQGWRSSIDHSLDILIFSRWPPKAANLAARFPGISLTDMGWLQSRPRALQRLQQLLRQLARLRSIPKLVLGQGVLMDSLLGPELDLHPVTPYTAAVEHLQQLQACLAKLPSVTSLAVTQRPNLQRSMLRDSDEPDDGKARQKLVESLLERQQQDNGSGGGHGQDGTPSLLPLLQELDVTGPGLVALLVLALVGREALAGVTRLRVVDSGGRPAEGTRDTRPGHVVQQLEQLEQLQCLELVNVPAECSTGVPRDHVVLQIKKMEQLRSLVLRAVHLTATQVNWLRYEVRVPSLQQLLLDSCTGADVAAMLEAAGSAFPSMRECRLRDVRRGPQQPTALKPEWVNNPPAEPTFEALEMLDLESCTEMAVLPPALARMGGLLWLRLHKLGRLRELELPEALQGLQHLVLGPLQGARDLPANMFAHLLELHTLDLSACDMPSFGPKELPSVTHLLKLRALLLPKDYLLDANMVLALGVALQLQELEATAQTAMEAMQLVHCLRGSQRLVAVFRSGMHPASSDRCLLPSSVLPCGDNVRVSTAANATVHGSLLELWEEAPACPAWLLRKLQVLALEDCQLGSPPYHLGLCPHLRHLSLSHNRLSALPAALFTLSHLTHLNASQNDITAVPHELWRMSQLRFIDLSHNKIISLEQEGEEEQGRGSSQQQQQQLAPASPLRLNLSYNGMASLPAALLARWTRMQILNLKHNQLEALPAALWDMPQLEALLLNGNQLEELPQVPPGCAATEKLQELAVSDNDLYSLPSGLAGLEKLLVLEVDATVAGLCSGLVEQLRAAGRKVEVARGVMRPTGWRDETVAQQVVSRRATAQQPEAQAFVPLHQWMHAMAAPEDGGIIPMDFDDMVNQWEDEDEDDEVLGDDAW